MRKLVVSEFVSLDGVMEAPGGEDGYPHGAWTVPYWGDDLGEFKTAELEAADALLLGRVQYEGFAGAWPERGGDPFSDKMNSMRKFVVSSTLEDPAWENTQVLEGDPARGRRRAEGRGGRRHPRRRELHPGQVPAPGGAWSTSSAWRCTRSLSARGSACSTTSAAPTWSWSSRASPRPA